MVYGADFVQRGVLKESPDDSRALTLGVTGKAWSRVRVEINRE